MGPPWALLSHELTVSQGHVNHLLRLCLENSRWQVLTRILGSLDVCIQEHCGSHTGELGHPSLWPEMDLQLLPGSLGTPGRWFCHPMINPSVNTVLICLSGVQVAPPAHFFSPALPLPHAPAPSYGGHTTIPLHLIPTLPFQRGRGGRL